MNRRIPFLALITIWGILLILFPSSPSQALIPDNLHYVRYINPDYSITHWVTTNEEYAYDTLPNEWVLSWADAALQAGAVIIRSGAYWRVNRSVLQSPWPNNNCYQVWEWGSLRYVTAPRTRGGREQWIPLSRQSRSISATDATYRYHAERVSLLSGRPDKLVSLRYNSTIQTRTRDGTGGWLDRIRYAYVGPGAQGSPYNPNVDCSQTDGQTYADPTYPNY